MFQGGNGPATVRDPRDQTVYRVAVAMLGLALVAALLGVSWVAAEHECVKNIPVELWFACGAVGGVFVGALIPFTLRRRPYRNDADPRSSEPVVEAVVGGGLLVAICVTAAVIGIVHESSALYALAVTVGGVLLGLPIPSPGRMDP